MKTAQFFGSATALKLAGLAAAVAIVRRGNSWTNPDGGNTHIDLGDKKINYGTTPPWHAFDKIKGHCTSNGCNGQNILVEKTSIIKDGESKPGEIKISVEGTLNQEPEQGNLDQMVELVKAAAGSSPYDVDKDVPYHMGSGCSVSGFIPCDPGESASGDQYHLTDTINVRVESPDGEAFMNVYVTVEEEGSSGVCEAITEVGGAMAGMVNGVFGGIFGLAKLGCA